MIWIAPSEKDHDNAALEKRLWDAAEQSVPAPHFAEADRNSARPEGLFLRFAEVRFAAQRAKLEKASASARRGSRVDEPAAYHAEGILYLPAEARFDYLLNRPEAENIGAKVNAAMRNVAKCEVRVVKCEVRPVRQSKFVIRTSPIPASLDYDAFGGIYERGECRSTKCELRSAVSSTVETRHSQFARSPSSSVRLLTEVIEPYHGRILDPACGSGGMFVSSARFVSEHKKNPAAELSIHAGFSSTDKAAVVISRERSRLFSKRAISMEKITVTKEDLVRSGRLAENACDSPVGEARASSWVRLLLFPFVLVPPLLGVMALALWLVLRKKSPELRAVWTGYLCWLLIASGVAGSVSVALLIYQKPASVRSPTSTSLTSLDAISEFPSAAVEKELTPPEIAS
ncbi:MAG: SAM-dependent DNA methyltransferase [Pedosphaera sp.]|nr:SAM-dependent DNA methyltransferase [Pedosphaera sp.]